MTGSTPGRHQTSVKRSCGGRRAIAPVKKRKPWLYRQLRVYIPLLIVLIVIGQVLKHKNKVASPPQQVAALITKTVQEQLHKDISIGSDPAATHVSSDCNETTKTAQQTNYTCFSYLSAPASKTEVQEWQGRITAAGGMKAHLVTTSGPEVLSRSGGSSATPEEGGS
jgi:hypothetical protein